MMFTCCRLFRVKTVDLLVKMLPTRRATGSRSFPHDDAMALSEREWSETRAAPLISRPWQTLRAAQVNNGWHQYVTRDSGNRKEQNLWLVKPNKTRQPKQSKWYYTSYTNSKTLTKTWKWCLLHFCNVVVIIANCIRMMLNANPRLNQISV